MLAVAYEHARILRSHTLSRVVLPELVAGILVVVESIRVLVLRVVVEGIRVVVEGIRVVVEGIRVLVLRVAIDNVVSSMNSEGGPIMDSTTSV